MGESSGISGGSTGLWYRVHAVTASSLSSAAAADYASILPAALHAARNRRPFIAGWLSRGGGAPLELVTNAGPLPTAGRPGRQTGPEAAGDSAAPGPADAAVVELLFPWGARGSRIDQNMIDELDQLVWAPCPGQQIQIDAAAGDRTRSPAADQSGAPTLFESALQTLIGRPFGWLIVADPTDQLDAEIAELQAELSVLHQYEADQARFEARRVEQRVAELDRFREAGLWQVRVLVGAASEQDLGLIAPMLVGSVDLSAHPYRLRCPAGAQEFADVLAAKLTGSSDGSAVPFAATAGALAALSGLPRTEVPGVRLMRTGLFDVTADASVRTPAVELGRILDGRDCEIGPFAVPLATLNRHGLVTGATGSGKSETVRHLLEQLTRAGIGWLAIEPVRSEYAGLAARLADVRRAADEGDQAGHVILVNPADPEAVPLSVNPLAPEPGYPVQGHIEMVRALFVAAFDGREPFPQIISQALQRIYADCGWHPQTGGGRADPDTLPAVPTLARLGAAAVGVIADAGYGRELQAAMRGFIDVRLGSLQSGAAA